MKVRNVPKLRQAERTRDLSSPMPEGTLDASTLLGSPTCGSPLFFREESVTYLRS